VDGTRPVSCQMAGIGITSSATIVLADTNKI
jgi:hypothetical protein